MANEDNVYLPEKAHKSHWTWSCKLMKENRDRVPLLPSLLLLLIQIRWEPVHAWAMVCKDHYYYDLFHAKPAVEFGFSQGTVAMPSSSQETPSPSSLLQGMHERCSHVLHPIRVSIYVRSSKYIYDYCIWITLSLIHLLFWILGVISLCWEVWEQSSGHFLP